MGVYEARADDARNIGINPLAAHLANDSIPYAYVALFLGKAVSVDHSSLQEDIFGHAARLTGQSI